MVFISVVVAHQYRLSVNSRPARTDSFVPDMSIEHRLLDSDVVCYALYW